MKPKHFLPPRSSMPKELQEKNGFGNEGKEKKKVGFTLFVQNFTLAQKKERRTKKKFEKVLGEEKKSLLLFFARKKKAFFVSLPAFLRCLFFFTKVFFNFTEASFLDVKNYE